VPVPRRFPPLLLVLALRLGAEEGGAAAFREKPVEERARIAGASGDEALLLVALGDREWEVVECAARRLGEVATARSAEALLDLALRGPTRGIRIAAARAALRADPVGTPDALARRVAKESDARLLDALAVVPAPAAADRCARLVKGDDRETRRLALRALAALRDPALAKELAGHLRDDDPVIRAGAIEALVMTGDEQAANPLLAALREARIPDVLERRLLDAVRAIAAAQKDAARIGKLCLAGFQAEPSARRARLLRTLGARETPLGPVGDYVRALRGAAENSRDVDTRAAAVAALGALGDPAGLPAIETLAARDPSPRVRFHALRAAFRVDARAGTERAKAALAADAAPFVREEAAALLGRHRVADAAQQLAGALKDADWTVAVSAAVSLGKCRAPEGLPALEALLGHKDWRLRGAAAAGLGWIRRKEAVPLLIAALQDRDLSVVWTAREALRHVAGKAVGDKAKEWLAWWEPRKESFEFADRDAEAREAKRYGYAVAEARVYDDLDVVVLVTRGGGDNIQDLLQKLGIGHRLTRAASVDQAALHPDALFVANCPGEIVAKDVDRISWFVRTGGYLFASCWALTETVGKAFPDVARKVETKGEVIGTVPAGPVPDPPPFVREVFDAATRPNYELRGSHLIDVLDPERCEVLVDSPACAATWGEGDLACWFTVGHGLVLDSANHFDLQGMKQARLKTEEERMAFAIDHLGYGHAELRRLRDAGVFRSQSRAADETRDLTIFRLITAFVRQKRLAEER